MATIQILIARYISIVLIYICPCQVFFLYFVCCNIISEDAGLPLNVWHISIVNSSGRTYIL